MDWSAVRPAAYFELLVMVCQVVGVAALCLHRLLPAHRCGELARVVFVFAILGLGLNGALCGRHDSEFALFAGGTMTVLLIGMIVGKGHADMTPSTLPHAATEPQLAG